MPSTHRGRRAFLRTAALAPFAGSLATLHAAAKPGARPRNIVFMVADGMSPGVLPLAEHFSRRVRGKGLLWRELMERSEAAHGLMDMASLNSVTTDSSAASSSWGSGVRIFNGAVNTLPDGTALTPIATVARDAGRRVGLVTTTTVTHATPAGFAASTRSRSAEEAIAAQYIDNVDVVLGGGLRFFEGSSRKDGCDLLARYAQAGFTHLANRRELKQCLNGPRMPAKMLGLFSHAMIPYSLDRLHDAALEDSVPTLAEMTSAALASLRHSPKGFLLLVEGGRVDHAAHNNDAAAQLWEQLAFDEAIETVLAFAGEHPETLIVITADHGNGNPAIGGKWAMPDSSANGFAMLERARWSFDRLLPKLAERENQSPEAVHHFTREAFGFELEPHEVEAVRASAAGGKRLSLNTRLDKPAGILGQAVGNHTGIAWVSTDHTSDYVVVTALGPGRERFAGHIRNTSCFESMVDLMGSRFRNPAMSAAAARRHMRAAVVADRRPHWV